MDTRKERRVRGHSLRELGRRARIGVTISLAVCAGYCLYLTSGCASLPDIDAVPADAAEVQVKDEQGTLPRYQSAEVINRLKNQSSNTSILDRHLALEQAIVNRPLVAGNKVVLLQDGRQTYRAMFAAIRKARHNINLETYIFADDEVGHQFARLLVEKQLQGVQVNLIYDSVGAIHTPKEFFEQLRASGIRTLEFNPINPLSARKEWLINNRDHRKLLIVDGHTVFLGGVNISSVYSRGSSSSRSASAKWRDTHVQITGPVVAEYQKLFLDTWKKQNGEPLHDKAFFPRLKEDGRDVVHAIGSSADDPHSLIYLTLISAITNAESQVYLTNAYFVPDPQLLQALQNAAQRGVDVRLILPSHTDFWVVFHAGRSHYSDLLKAGVKIYERRGAILHSKTAFIDGVWSCIGSTNLDWRSFLHNDEINAVVLGAEFARQMRAMFEMDLAESDAIELDEWKNRSLVLRLKEWFARLWEYWL